MSWFILMNIFSVLLAFIRIGRLSDHEKDLEILILRQQLNILQRKYHKPINPNRADKMILSVLATRLKRLTDRSTTQLRSIIRIFQPGTVFVGTKNSFASNGLSTETTMVEGLPYPKNLKT